MDGIANSVGRAVEFIHIPVPRHANGQLLAPLRKWSCPLNTQLYLGLLQFNDDAGNRSRIAAARRVVDEFGIGAECGFGRADPARIAIFMAGFLTLSIQAGLNVPVR